MNSSFTMPTGKAACIYANTAEFAADDLYANINATVLSLPAVDGMSLGDSMTATGWYCDYAENDTAYNNSTLLDITQFPNPNAVTAESIERYRYAAEFSETTPYRVSSSLANVSGKYVCLTIGSNIINFGKIVINKTVSDAADQYFIFHVQSNELQNKALGTISFEVTIKGKGSIVIDKVPFGTYTISEQEDWSWRYKVDNGQASQSMTVDSSDNPVSVTFTNELDTSVAYDTTQQSSLWLDGNSQSKVNVYGQRQATAQNSQNVLGALFLRKEDAA